MVTLTRFLFGVVAALVALLLAHIDPALAQEAAAEAAPAAAAAASVSPINTGDTAWMLTSTALVLMMTIPGLALFYGGMVRKKNVLATVGTSFRRDLHHHRAVDDHRLLDRVHDQRQRVAKPLDRRLQLFLPEADDNRRGQLAGGDHSGIGATCTFQMTFAIITPALIAGSLADRMKFSAFMLFMGLWLIFVYCPIAHWVWGGGWLGAMGALDYAGGTVVHLNAGTAGLVCALVLGPRYGLGKENMSPYNLVYSVIGASLLWVGWFGFNAGSAVTANVNAGMAMAATQIATAAAALVVDGVASGSSPRSRACSA